MKENSSSDVGKLRCKGRPVCHVSHSIRINDLSALALLNIRNRRRRGDLVLG